MNTNDTELDNISSPEFLLPWYVAGTLSASEAREVEAWLESDPEAKAHLARAKEEQHVAMTAAEEIPLPRASAVNNLMRAIGASSAQTTNTPSLSERFWSFVSPRWAMAGAAALVLLVVAQGATIGVMMSPNTQSFETASGGTATSVGIDALVAFQPDQNFAEISAYLTDNQLRIVDGPKPGGIYRIAAADTEEGRAALQRLGDDTSRVSFFSIPTK